MFYEHLKLNFYQSKSMSPPPLELNKHKKPRSSLADIIIYLLPNPYCHWIKNLEGTRLSPLFCFTSTSPFQHYSFGLAIRSWLSWLLPSTTLLLGESGKAQVSLCYSCTWKLPSSILPQGKYKSHRQVWKPRWFPTPALSNASTCFLHMHHTPTKPDCSSFQNVPLCFLT